MSTAVDPFLSGLNDCGCCAGTALETPVAITNRPGLSAIAYRAGTQPQFKKTLLARLALVAGLHTREDDDFSIALLDAWAVVADVLTFYQERIASESYLRTATERRSILELARLIGYEPRPGVAASAYLAFTLEDAPGAPDQAAKPAQIASGTKVQSIPGPGEQSQIFETVEMIEARVAWNAIRPRLTQRHPIKKDADTLYIAGTATGLKPGDGLLITPDDGSAPVFRPIAAITPQGEQQRTRVQLQDLAMPSARTFGTELQPLGAVQETDMPRVAELRAAAALQPIQIQTLASTQAVSAGGIAQTTLAVLSPSPITIRYLTKTVSADDFTAVAQIQDFQVQEIFNNLVATRPPPPSVLAFRARASLFGHNAPDWNAMPDSVRKNYGDTDKSHPLTEWPFVAPPLGNLDLDAVNNQITPDSWVVVKWPAATVITQVDSATDTGAAGYTLSAKVTRLTLKPLKLTDQVAPASFVDDVRKTTVLAQSEELALARLPIEDPVVGAVIDLDGWVDGLYSGQSIIVCGELDLSRGNRDCEQATLSRIEHLIDSEGFTRITLKTALKNGYVRDTVTINANVALATHGETVGEAWAVVARASRISVSPCAGPRLPISARRRRAVRNPPCKCGSTVSWGTRRRACLGMVPVSACTSYELAMTARPRSSLGMG
jgi:hypothetical protein